MKIRLRPHHILCVRFFEIKPPDRGDDFDSLCMKVRELMTSGTDTPIEVTEGVDDLCVPCPNLGENKCISPFGDEDEVRRWDARVLTGLGITYGQTWTAADLRNHIDERVPLEFCRTRCPWKSICTVGKIKAL